MSEICVWAKKLAAWEQQVLLGVFRRESFSEDDYAAFADLMLSEKNDAAPADFSPFESEQSRDATQKPQLVRISDAINVNALAEGQQITFGPQATVVYGANGSGKSGYARVFGSSCFSRGDREVLPDLFEAGSDSIPKSVNITISVGGVERTISHAFDGPKADLSAFYVFDTTCVSSHLEKANALTFSPVGLSALNELVRHTDKVRAIANARIAAAKEPHTFSRLFADAETTVAAEIAGLGASSNLSRISALAEVSQDDVARIAVLEREIAQLKLLDVPKAVQAVQAQLSSMRTLRSTLNRVSTELGDARIDELNELLKERTHRREQAVRAGVDQFSIEGLREIGSPAWNEFLHAAKLLADRESTSEKPYPQPGTPCLLCHQPLSDKTAELLYRLWDFLKGEAKRLLAECESQVAHRRQVVAALPCDAINESSPLDAILREWNLELLLQVNDFLGKAGSFRDDALHAIDAESTTNLETVSLPSIIPPLLDEIEQRMAKKAEELLKNDQSSKLCALQGEWLEFEHRRVLSRNLDAITAYVTQVKWGSNAEKKVKDSRHITKKYNELFASRVTDRYREVFEELLQKLGRPLKARIATRGQKGATVKVLALDLPEGVKHVKASPEHVFSEGEKRAVVLADFLAEATLDPGSSAIILDDPVTSLDAEWKASIADLLADTARQRQVVVFTHDLHFLYLLRASAKRLPVDLQVHWMQRGLMNGEPGYVALHNSPATELDFKTSKNAQELLQRAMKTSGPQEQEVFLKAGFGALRTSYEVFVMADLFGDVVRRFEERISIDRLKEAILDSDVVEAVIEKVGLLSRYIEGHSHSDAYLPVKPTVETLKAEIADFDGLKGKVKELKKKRANP